MNTLRRNRSGQAIVFGVITLFLLALAVVVVYDVGAVVSRKMEIQQAADAAAMAGAQIEANAVSTIAWMNDGMAYIYYNICRYAVDVGIYGTLAELKETGPPYPGDTIVGTVGAVSKYDRAYETANKWIPRGEAMLQQISKIEAAIALSTPVLVEMEVYRVAQENGADAASIFPKFVMFPDPDSHFIMDIRRIPGGWEMISDRGDEIIAQVTGDESWWISATRDGQTVELSVDKIGKDLFRIIYDGPDGVKTIYIRRTPYGDIISEGDSNLTITQNPDGSTTVIQDGQSITYRVNDDGTIEVKQGNTWVPIDMDQSVAVDGGPEVRVTNFTRLQVGESTWVAPNSIDIYNIHITLTDPIHISGQMGPAWISVDDNAAVVNGLSTANADGKWHLFRDNDWRDASDRQMQDRVRHRMTELTEGQEWEYEWVKTGSYLFPDSKKRFVEHALMDNDPVYKETGDIPEWCTLFDDGVRRGWFSLEGGKPSNWNDYYQIRQCWHPLEDPDYDGRFPDPVTGQIITCPLCRGIDNDGDGKTDVMVTQRDSLDRKGMQGFDDDGIDRQSINTDIFEMPLVLTEEFFKFPICVGTYAEALKVPQNLLENPDWGLFSIASARAGFVDPESGKFIMRFETAEDRLLWVDGSYQNLYEPTWQFRMVSCRDAIRSSDIDVIEDNESGANFLYRGIANAFWRDGYFGNVDSGISWKIFNMSSPLGQIFDVTDIKLEEVIEH